VVKKPRPEKKLTRKDLKKQDAFQRESSKVWTWVQENRVPFIVGLVAVAVVAVGLTVFSEFREGRANRASRGLGRALELYFSPLKKDAPPKDVAEEVLLLDGEAPLPKFDRRADQLAAALERFRGVREEFSGSGPAEVALLAVAGTLYDLGDFEKAAQAYVEYLGGAAGDQDLRDIATEALGLCYENVGKLDQAAAEFAKLRREEPSLLGARVDYHLGRIAALQGKPDEARRRFKNLLKDHPDTPLKDEIETRLLLLYLPAIIGEGPASGPALGPASGPASAAASAPASAASAPPASAAAAPPAPATVPPAAAPASAAPKGK